MRLAVLRTGPHTFLFDCSAFLENTFLFCMLLSPSPSFVMLLAHLPMVPRARYSSGHYDAAG